MSSRTATRSRSSRPSAAARSASSKARSTSTPCCARSRIAEAGAVASFVGTVRRRSRGRDVLHLEYEAYEEMAEPMLAELGDELTERHGLCAVAVHHRLGRVEIGEASVVIAVSAPHRAAALDACREAIETLKTTIPLWKKEVYAGGEEWIGRQRHRMSDPEAQRTPGAGLPRSARSASPSSSSAWFAKFFGFFVSFAAYSVWFHSWRFALGFVLLILVHELGHFFEARRQGLHGHAADLHPVLRRVRHRSPGERRRGEARSSPLAGPLRRRPRRGGGVGGRLGAEHDLARRARQHRLPAQRRSTCSRSASSTAEPSSGPSRMSRRGWIRYENGIPVEARPAGPGARRSHHRPLRAARGGARRRDARDAGTAGCSEPDERPRRPRDAPLARRISARHSEAIARGVPRRASRRSRRSTVPPSPASGRHARRKDRRRTSSPARPRGSSREAGWAVVTGGGPGVMEAANRGCRKAAGSRWASGSSCPHEQRMNDYIDLGLDLRPLLRPQDDVREGGRGLLRLPRRLRHGRRAVRVVDPDPDRQGSPLPGRAARRGVLDAAAGVGAPQRARRRDGRGRGSRAAHADGRPARRARDGARRLPRRRRGARARTSHTRPTRSSVCAMELRDLPSVDELAREADDPLAVEAARAVIDRAREEIQTGTDPGDLAARLRDGAGRRTAAAPAARAQRDRRRRPHESRPRAAGRGGGRAGRRCRAGLLEPRVRPERGRPRLAPGSRRGDPAPADRRGSGARRQQQRRRSPPRPGRAGGGPRRRRLARRADRDRRRLPDPGRPRTLRCAARRDRHDEPDARRRLRARDRARDRRPAARPPVELPRRRLRGAAAARGGRRRRAPPRPPARGRPRLRRDRAGRSRADGARVARGRRRPRLLLGRQAARRPAGRDRARPRRARRAAAAAPAPARAAHRQALARGARGDAPPPPRGAGADPCPAHARAGEQRGA